MCNARWVCLTLITGAAWCGGTTEAAEAEPAPCPPPVAADYYLAPDGSDANPGTATSPFATLARARDAVRRHLAGGLTRDLLVLIRGGTYRQDETLTFGPQDSAGEKYSVTYAAYPGEKVVLSGGRRITGWRKGSGEIWTAELPEVKAGTWYFRQLFVDGRQAIRARTPNWGDKNTSWWKIGKSTVDRSKPPARDVAITLSVDHPIKAWENASDVELVFLDNNDGGRRRLSGIDEAEQTVTIPPPQMSISPIFVWDWRISIPAAGKACFLENARELLDEPGEWYLSRKTGVLSYWPRPGEEMSRVEAVAPVVQKTLLAVAGTPQRPVRNLNFKGIHVEHVDWPLPPTGYYGVFGCLIITEGDKPVHRWMDAAVSFEHARSCSFAGGGIAHVGGMGLCLLKGTACDVVEGNEICDLGAGGIGAGGLRSQFTLKWNPPPKDDEYKGLRIANNYIHDCGKAYYGAIGIFCGMTQDAAIAHNLIHDTAYSGMVVSGNEDPSLPFAKNVVVEYNEVHDMMKVATDGAGLYISCPFAGRGAVLRGNLFHDNRPSPFSLREIGSWSAPGMYLDGAVGSGRDYTFARNVVFQSTQWPLFLFACGKEGNHFIDNVFLKEGTLPTVLVEALRARCGLEPAYRRALLKTNDPQCNEHRLASDGGSPAAWTAYQLDLPQAGRGVVEVFRRCDAKVASLRVKPRGLDLNAVYDLEAWLGTVDPQDDLLLTGVAPADRSAAGPEVLATGQARMTGRQLAQEGLLVRLAARPQAAWIVYRRAQGLAAMAEVDCPRGEIPLAVVLEANHSSSAAGTIRKYTWDLGDGTTAEGPTVQHVYRVSGGYTARLTVADEKGTTDQARVAIVATPVDATPPAIARVDAGDPEKVVVTFSKPVEQVSAEAAANYAIDLGVRVFSASLGEDPAVVALATSPLSPGARYVLSVNDVKDCARRPNIMAADSRAPLTYSGLLARWKLTEGKGDAIADCSGNGHLGVLKNGPQWAAGRQGAALRFDGTRSYVEMDTCLPELTVPLSIAFWVNPAKSQVANADILGNHGEGFLGLVVQQEESNTNAFSLGYGDGTRWLGTGPVKLAADAWQHVAIVCDGRDAIMYVNGVQKSKSPANGPLAINPYQRFRLGLGYKPGFGRCFHGLLQDVRIYRRALSAAEITEMAMVLGSM